MGAREIMGVVLDRRRYCGGRGFLSAFLYPNGTDDGMQPGVLRYIIYGTMKSGSGEHLMIIKAKDMGNKYKIHLKHCRKPA